MKLLYQGKDIYPEVSVNRCYHDMYGEKQSDELLLRLNDNRRLWDTWKPQKGDTIAVEVGSAKTGQMYIDSILPEGSLITLRAFSVPQSAKDKRSKSWEKVRLLQLGKEIADRNGLGFEQYGVTDQLYEYVSQNNLPDFAFLQQRVTLEGVAVLVYDGKLIMYDEAYIEKQTPVKTVVVTPASKFEYRDDRVNAYGSAEVINGSMTGVFMAPNGGAKVLSKTIPVQMTSQAEANRFARGLLRDANKNSATGTLWTLLMLEYAAGSIVELQTDGVASWDGPALITRIRHDFTSCMSKIYFRRPLEGY